MHLGTLRKQFAHFIRQTLGELAVPRGKLFTHGSLVEKGARGAQIIMALILLVAGGAKVWEPILFYWETVPYTQLLGLSRESFSQVAQVSLLLAPVECAVGVALLVNWRPKLTFPVAIVMMVAFLALTVHAWRQGAGIDCGCFGSLVDRSPGEAAVEDAIMLSLLLFGWWGTRNLSAPLWAMGGRLVWGGLALALVVGGVRFFPSRDRITESDLQVGLRLKGVGAQGLKVNLMEGEYLVEFFSPKCGRCKQEVPKLNQWSQDSDLPPVVALNSFAQDSAPLQEFKRQLRPSYPIGTISKTEFVRLTWRYGYPRLAYLRDGVVKAVWEDNETPTREQLMDEMEPSKNSLSDGP